jgi:hypothetical protein
MMKQKFRKKVGVRNPKIQGLYPERNSCQSFWSLKAQVELAEFREPKNTEAKK